MIPRKPELGEHSQGSIEYMLMLLAILAVAASILYLIFTSSGSLEKGVYRGAEDALREIINRLSGPPA